MYRFTRQDSAHPGGCNIRSNIRPKVRVPPLRPQHLPLPFDFSLVPEVVETWCEDLNSKNRPKLAARIASPSKQPDAFAEGWEDVLDAERSSRSDGVLVDL